MENKNPSISKSYKFSLRIIQLYLHLIKVHKVYPLATQVLKSGTSIGANVEEAQGSVSKRDFKNKMAISYKEARETHYWLRLFQDSNLLESRLANSLIKDCEELLKIIGSIVKNTKT